MWHHDIIGSTVSYTMIQWYSSFAAACNTVLDIHQWADLHWLAGVWAHCHAWRASLDRQVCHWRGSIQWKPCKRCQTAGWILTPDIGIRHDLHESASSDMSGKTLPGISPEPCHFSIWKVCPSFSTLNSPLYDLKKAWKCSGLWGWHESSLACESSYNNNNVY